MIIVDTHKSLRTGVGSILGLTRGEGGFLKLELELEHTPNDNILGLTRGEGGSLKLELERTAAASARAWEEGTNTPAAAVRTTSVNIDHAQDERGAHVSVRVARARVSGKGTR